MRQRVEVLGRPAADDALQRGNAGAGDAADRVQPRGVEPRGGARADPQRRLAGNGQSTSGTRSTGSTTRPSGFSRSDATFARNLFGATPTEAVSRSASTMRLLSPAAIAAPASRSRAMPVRSRNASSIEIGSTAGVASSRIARIRPEIAR